MITIEKNIPMPPFRTGPKAIWTISEMEIGDSFLIDPKHRSKMTQLFIRHNFKCATRKEGDKIRVWRVAND